MPADYISFQSDVQRFDRMVLQTMEESATGFAYCKDLDTLYILDQPDEEIVNEFVDLYRPYFWSAAAVLNEPRNSTCLDMVSHCNDAEARMLRQVCGVTCGCADPRSYPVYKVPHKGCSRNCLSNAASPEQPICEDIENGAMWKQFWDGYPTVLSSEIGVMLDYNSTLGQWVLQLIGAMQEFGCAALAFHPELAKEPVTQQRWCDGIDELIAPLARICPESCGCTNASHASHIAPSPNGCNPECHALCRDAGLSTPIQNVSTCSEAKAFGLCTIDEFKYKCLRTCKACHVLLDDD